MREQSIQIKRVTGKGSVNNVISLVRTLVDRMGYVKARIQLQRVYGVYITIDYRDLA